MPSPKYGRCRLREAQGHSAAIIRPSARGCSHRDSARSLGRSLRCSASRTAPTHPLSAAFHQALSVPTLQPPPAHHKTERKIQLDRRPQEYWQIAWHSAVMSCAFCIDRHRKQRSLGNLGIYGAEPPKLATCRNTMLGTGKHRKCFRLERHCPVHTVRPSAHLARTAGAD